ncbi:hypothetical protein ACFLU6_09195 [Acidobacteriota bacterium]
MAKKKRQTHRQKSSKKKQRLRKADPVAQLRKEHPDLSHENIIGIVQSGLSVSEWRRRQIEKHEARRIANEERKLTLICSRHPEINRDQALEIIRQNVTPEDYLLKMGHQRKKEIKEKKQQPAGQERQTRKQEITALIDKHAGLSRAVAGQIISGQFTYEQYAAKQLTVNKESELKSIRPPEQIEQARQRRMERRKQIEERVRKESHLSARGDAHLKQLIESKEEITIHRFFNTPVSGTLRGIELFRLIIKTDINPSFAIGKLSCAFLCSNADETRICEQVRVDLDQMVFHQFPPRSPDLRYQIPEELLREGSALGVMLHNGFLLVGTVLWADRFQFVLRLPSGGDPFVFRHSVFKAGTEAFEVGLHPTLSRVLAEPPELKPVYPSKISVAEIIVPDCFDDFPVQDEKYECLLNAFERGGLALAPIQVRREGGHYVLVDGYRRLTLARQKSLASVPIELER